MTGLQLATRLDVRPQTVEALEKSEASGSIQLGTLRRAAEAMGCTLVYALVPNSSLEDAVNRRARKIAMRGARACSPHDEARSAGDRR
jgi:predicted DNA-binding mobile mystery protein A